MGGCWGGFEVISVLLGGRYGGDGRWRDVRRGLIGGGLDGVFIDVCYVYMYNSMGLCYLGCLCGVVM